MRYIELTKGRRAIVDDEDYLDVSQWKWYCQVSSDGSVYARRTKSFYEGGKRTSEHVRLGRYLLGAPADLVVDYINGDTLDNRRSNIRLATRGEDNGNTRRRKNHHKIAPYKGVRFDKRYGSWDAVIVVDKKRIYLGTYKTPEEAAKAYDVAAIEHFGQFAHVNGVQ